jgi:hypothetical protein
MAAEAPVYIAQIEAGASSTSAVTAIAPNLPKSHGTEAKWRNPEPGAGQCNVVIERHFLVLLVETGSIIPSGRPNLGPPNASSSFYPSSPNDQDGS